MMAVMAVMVVMAVVVVAPRSPMCVFVQVGKFHTHSFFMFVATRSRSVLRIDLLTMVPLQVIIKVLCMLKLSTATFRAMVIGPLSWAEFRVRWLEFPLSSLSGFGLVFQLMFLTVYVDCISLYAFVKAVVALVTLFSIVRFKRVTIAGFAASYVSVFA